METRSGRRLSSPPPPPGACRGRAPRDADLISALPYDILLLVLVRLRCVLAAARTGVLARRWRDLWTRLPDLALHRVAPATVESALARFAASPAVSLIHIRLQFGHTAAQANSLLRAAAAVSPAELVCKCPGSREDRFSHIELPCFRRTISIELETLFGVKPPTAGELAALERLSLHADVFDLGALLNRCPRLRVLSATFWDTELLMLQSVRELPALERLTLNGNIADLGTFLNRCPRLRLISITFRSVAPDSLEQALATIAAVAAHGTAVSLLGIRVPSEHSDDTVLLRAAARLSPQEFAFMHLLDAQGTQYTSANLPCFPRTTSIKIAVHNICFTRLLDGEFSKLERLSLEGCIINDLGTLLSRCPRLRVLKVKTAMSRHDIKVHSASLQELVFGTHTECRGIEIVTPMLKQLKMEVQADKDIRVFISAPLLEMVWWRRSYTGSPIVFGVWHLQNLSLERQRVLTDRHLQNSSSDGQGMLANKHLQNSSSDGQGMLANKHLQNLFEREGVLTYNHVLSMDMCASDSSDAELDFAQEIRKILVTDFSVLNLSLGTMGHVYGATLFQLFSVLQVRSAMKILKVDLQTSKKSEVTQACSENCPCDSPKIWRSQSISMIHLEEVEIKGVIGEVHEFDALKLILRCAPLLKRMTVELGDEMEPYGYGGCPKEINDISLEYPSVDFHVYPSGTLVLNACLSCT